MADKARLFLEQGIPELKEFEKKKIFTKEEIQSISKKRSEFEHRINAQRCKPGDFVRYAQYEMNLDSLRKKRVKRLGVKAKTFLGSRRINFVFERGTRRFHGDIALWLQYIDYIRKENSGKLLKKILTELLRLHPSKPELWIHAARCVLDDDNDDIGARNYLRQGLRMNGYSKNLWLEYAKFELVFISKILARRAILGLDEVKDQRDLEDDIADMEDLILLDSVKIVAKEGEDDSERLKSLESSKILQGEMPKLIFNQAMAKIPNDLSFAIAFFDLFTSFSKLSCYKSLLGHVNVYSTLQWPDSPDALFCHTKEPIVGVSLLDPAFPPGFTIALSRFSDGLEKVEDKHRLYELFTTYLHDILVATVENDEELDASLKLALVATLRKQLKAAGRIGSLTPTMVEIQKDLDKL